MKLIFSLAVVFSLFASNLKAQNSSPPDSQRNQLESSTPKLTGRQTVDLSGAGWKLWQDKAASWENDELFLPPVDMTKVPTNAPSGGWEALAQGIPVSVPGTAEEYLGKGIGPESIVEGVTWWVRDFVVPANAEGKKIRLLFDSTRLRAEVYVNRKLVAYDIIGSTPFEADISKTVKPGEKVQLAVRITNPGGNYDWRDYATIKWGKYTLPMSHGIGGVTGGVHLVVSDPVYIDDLYIQNTPEKTAVKVISTVMNTSPEKLRGNAEISIREKASGKQVFTQKLSDLDFKPGETQFTFPVSVPEANLWELDNPNLYKATVTINSGTQTADALEQTFGFRWFAPEGIGSNAQLRLNGKRIVLRTAVSWGLWPITGEIPSPELAVKQIQTAKAYGLNMLNCHRCIGHPLLFDKADEMGFLYFEEPGAYLSARKDPFAVAISREKLLRMVKRDRSHPSIIIYNMMNETGPELVKDPQQLAIYKRDIQDAHAIDPSRVLLLTSGWGGRVPEPLDDPLKSYYLPYDDTIHTHGWWDLHYAEGSAVWKQEFYKSPTDYYGFTDDRAAVVYRGEEGAISAPPRLGLIVKELDRSKKVGWDGQVYRDWYKAFDDYLTSNNLRNAFPTVDDLCKAMSVVSIEHQGRKIENMRICDAVDGYAINGWESVPTENHSGVVDCFRNPKADPSIMAYYNQPLYVAVKPRKQISAFPGSVTVDFYLINEKDLKGELTLRIRACNKEGKETFTKNLPCHATGGDVYGERLHEAVEIPLISEEGMTTISATLVDGQGNQKATGHDQVFAVDWKNVPIKGSGAVYGPRVQGFLKKATGTDIPQFDDSQNKLDWLIVTRSPYNESVLIPKEFLLQPDGKTPGIQTSIFSGKDFSQKVCQRSDETINFNVQVGAPPDARFPGTQNYSVRWEGNLIPPATGNYIFTITYRNIARLWIDGKELLAEPKPSKFSTKDFTVTLAEGKAVPVKIELIQAANPDRDARMQLSWRTPIPPKIKPEQVMERASRDGTTLLILDHADKWLDVIGKATGISQGESFRLGVNWVGGQYFVKDHPLFAGLPVNQALNWPYQGVVGGRRNALQINGGELIAGAYNTWPMQLGSAVSILPCGKGSIIISGLDIISQLDNPDSSAEVARRLFCNFVGYRSPESTAPR